MTEETWLPIKSWEGLYEVSDLGRVRSLDREVRHSKNFTYRQRGAVLHPSPRHRGHLVVSLTQSPRRESWYVHRLVADAFLPNPENHPLVLHGDDDPNNNEVNNLRWGTYKDNAQDRTLNGGDANSNKTHCVRGHPYSPETTRVWNGSRFCRACNTLLAREYRKRKREDKTSE